MHHSIWISIIALSVFVITSEANGGKIPNKCPVSGLHLTCSSSNSVQFEWKLEPKWKSLCKNQILNINYFKSGTTINHYHKVDILEKEVLIKGLDRDKRYEFKFVHFINLNNDFHQVKNGYTKLEATPHGVGSVRNLKITNTELTSAVVAWSLAGECVSHYELHWCWQQLGREECLSRSVPATPEQYTLQNLTPCTTYSIGLTAVDIDQVRSSRTASQTFTTASDVAGSVRDLSIASVTPTSLSVAWVGHSCTPYTVLISSLHGGLVQPVHSAVTSNTSYTFSPLQPCSCYRVSVLVTSQFVDGGANAQAVQAYTSVVSTARVNSLGVSGVTDHGFTISWHPPVPWLICVTGYKVEVTSGDKLIQTRKQTSTYLDLRDLEPCTTYRVSVTVVFSNDTLSLESFTLSARTNAPARISNQRVENISVINQTADSLLVVWERPQLGPECLRGYKVFLYDSSYSAVYTHPSVAAEYTSFTFVNLKQCELYYIYVSPDFGNSDFYNLTQFRRQEFVETFTITTDEVVVTNLSMVASWNSLQLRWQPPLGYEVCTRHYDVRVCVEGECEGPITLNSTSYRPDNLLACTAYVAEVRAGHSHEVADVAGITRGPGTVTSNQLEVVNETSDSITFRWAMAEDFRNCKGRFVISLWHANGYFIEDKTRDHLTREFIAQDLTPCHSYSFALKLIDFADRPTIDYPAMNGITKASGDQKVSGLKVSPYPDGGGVTLEWSMDPGSTACVSHYQVSLKGQANSSFVYNTTALTFSWKGDPCMLETASVQTISEHKLAGQPAYIQVRKQFEDLSKLSARVVTVGARDAKIQMVTSGFVCVSDYTVSWYRVTNHSTTDTVANLSSVANQSVTLTQLYPCTTYSVGIAPRNGLAGIGVLRTTLTTHYAEPMLAPTVSAVPRGFNVTWHLYEPDTIYCLSHTSVSVTNNHTHQQVNVFADSHKVIGDLIPCQMYVLTLESFGQKEKSGKIFYNKWERVTPEVLSVPSKVILANVTRESATLEWDVGASDANMCEPRELKVECRPDEGLNMFVAGWRPATLRLTRLQPYTRYDCEFAVINEAGRSNGTHVSFITSEGVPSWPVNVTVVASSRSEVLVAWEPPDQVPGVLINYTVSVYNQTLTYPRPPTCPAPPLGPRHVVVRGNATQAVVGGLSPATSLWVSIAAATAEGYGLPSEPVPSATLDGVSNPVVGLNVTLDRRKVLLSWRLPCLTNGPLDHFLIKLNGTRPNHNTVFYAWNITAQQTFESYSTYVNVSLLTAESLYLATVVPVGETGLSGQYNSQNFTVPSRIPARPRDDVFAELPPVLTARSTATVSIRSDLFPDTEGSIRYYAILVAGNFSQGPDTAWIHNQSWPRTKNWAAAIQSHPVAAYQATQPWWDPFKGMDTTPFAIKQYTLGTEECSKTDLTSFCNGPLLPGTSYAVRVRAFTGTGYRDSPSITFQTVDPVVEAYLVVLVLAVIAVVTTIAFVYLVVTGHIKWVKEKKILTNSKSKTEENKIFLNCKRLPLVKFINHVENIVTSESLLEEEYKQVAELTSQITGTTTIARLPQNKIKNRYKDIIPYDSALVRLEGNESNSYINASHIKIQGKKSRHYIACQGPKEETCEDFWKMVIQYKVNPIVMLCMPCEEGKVKCFPYFPINSGEVVTFGGINVYCTKEDTFTGYIIRYLTIDIEGGTKMKVEHFHFTQWVDRGVPVMPESLVGFIEHIRKTVKTKHAVMAVHCSAGIGRTGTFIVMDELLRKIRKTWCCRLSVPDTVLRLREQRHHKMVQTKEQYCYIYSCLKFALEHHKSLSERDLGTEEVIQMHSSPGVRQTTTNMPEDCC